MSFDSEDPPLETVFDLLAHRRRREVVACLYEHGSLALADLAEEIARLENDVPITEISAEEVKRVYMSLWHSHIPKLVDFGVVEYSQERDIVDLAENADAMKRYIPLDGRRASTHD